MDGNGSLLAQGISEAPRVYDEDAASRLIDSIRADLGAASKETLKLIEGIGGASPYLSRLIISRRSDLNAIFNSPVEETMDRACASVRAIACIDGVAEQMKALRDAKAVAALTIALAEIGGALSTMKAAELLSDFADAALSGAIRASLNTMISKGFAPIDAAAPEQGCGIAIIAMGKHGARELNYSSDIDIIVLFDPATPTLGGDSAREVAVGATKLLVRLMQEQTADGYVFRTDLRLRPDPGVSAAAISVNAAESYYEAHGQNWERAAFIKARAAAGDIALGDRFLKSLRPFVWRKYLDFAALEDIHSIKRQIHASKGGAGIEFQGHDLKTGHGGIREIEFLAQTQQLILGGKNLELRQRRTLETLDGLCRHHHLSDHAGAVLGDAYIYLRKVEHRIQMINDEQTHKIPSSDAGVERLAAFLGEDSAENLRVKLEKTLGTTHDNFANLFEQEERLSSQTGTLSFTGVENNAQTIASLAALGFERPQAISDAVREWHTGSLRATRSTRARELLTKLTPKLLESLADASDPDEAFIAFEKFLSQLPSGVQIFSMFASSPDVFDRLIQIMTVAPSLGRDLAKRRHLVEALLEHAWPPPLPDAATLREALGRLLERAGAYEEKLNAARRWALEEKFQIAAQLVLGHLSPEEAAQAFTLIAEAAITAMTPVAQDEMIKAHGAINGALVVVGLGRLGAEQMTATSDIDLIFIYDAPKGAMSDGEKPLDPVTYFSRLVRRIVTSLTAATEEGALYDVDMQLRPSGGAGPAAVSKTAFVKYFTNDAWTWEVMALTKARMIVGDATLASFVSAEIDRIIARRSDAKNLAADVHNMRLRLADAKPGQGVWDVKNMHGGLTDLDFIWQYLQLRNGVRSGLLQGNTNSVNGLDDATVARLFRATELFESIIQIGRAATGGVFDPKGSGLALTACMSQACGTDNLEAAEKLIIRTQRVVKDVYAGLVEGVISSKGSGEKLK